MYGIYANIGGILMGSMLPYIAYMDPMGYVDVASLHFRSQKNSDGLYIIVHASTSSTG